MVNETILAVIIAFVVSAVLCPIVIPFLHRLKFGQQVRDDGPQTHLKNAGNPNDGRSGNSFQHHHYVSALYPGLSEDHSGAVYDRRIRRGWISGRLHQDRDETFGGLKSDPEADRTVCDHRYFSPIIL